MVKKSEVPGQLWGLSGSTTQAPLALRPALHYRRGKGRQASDQAGEDGRTGAKLSPPWLMRETRKHTGHLKERSRFLPWVSNAGRGVHQHPAQKSRDSQVRTSRRAAQGGPESQSPYPPRAHRGELALLVLSRSVASSSLYRAPRL